MYHINKFCNTFDTNHLDNLGKQDTAIICAGSVITLATPNCNHDLAKAVLNHYGRDHMGRKLGISDICHEKAEARAHDMTVAMTGARAGDILVGASKATRGAMIRIHGSDISPEENRLESVHHYDDIWKAFIIRLGAIPFFSEMSLLDREIWLDTNRVCNENSIGHENARVELIQPGNSDFSTRISNEDLEKLMSGNQNSSDGFWSNNEIESMIPSKPGSNARRHTLILIRCFWKVSTNYSVTQKFDGLILDPWKGVIQGGDAGINEEIFVLSGVCRSLQKKSASKWERNQVQDVGVRISRKQMKVSDGGLELYREAFKGFTCASYKSMLQKIIRFRPSHVELRPGIIVTAPEALRATILLLSAHPGSFVPDIQRFVTGLESASKRIAVSILEDSYVTEPGLKLFSLLTGSFLAQRVRSWRPDECLLESWIELAIEGWRNFQVVSVNNRREMSREPYIIGEGNDEKSILKSSSALLDEIKSFALDLGLARAWARDYPNLKLSNNTDFPGMLVMPVEHCIDHHWAPGVAHFFNPNYITKESSGRPFTNLYGVLWDKSSCINPRRMSVEAFDENADVMEIRSAQQLFRVALQHDQTMRPETCETYEMEYTLPDSWIAGMMGAIKLSGNPAMLVTLSTSNPYDLIVIRRPARNMKTDKLSKDAIDNATKAVTDHLNSGTIKLDQACAPHPSLERCKIRLRKGKYEIRQGQKAWVKWSNARKLKIILPVHPIVDHTLLSLLTCVGDGVQQNAEELLIELIEKTPAPVVRRALMYLNTFDKEIEMNRISRDGGATQQSVTVEDVGAYQFMLRLSGLYPAAISPKKHKPSWFVINTPPLLWSVRSIISKSMFGDIIADTGWHDVCFNDTSRTMWTHQTEITDEMIQNHQAGRKGNFIWASVGLGKTAAVLYFLQYLRDAEMLPKFIIYTLPESAIKSIITEIKYFGIPTNLIVPLAGMKKRLESYGNEGITISQSPHPKAYMINLVEHDHLRKCEEIFTQVAPESIFVVDEVHKTLNDTKRTSVALEIANLSRDFIALTGTPIIDANTYKLIAWLKLVVPYEVNVNNFWVAANSMIAKKVFTDAIVDDNDVLCYMDFIQQRDYNSLVPGALGGSNPSPVSSQWTRASEICYSAVSSEMVSLTKDFVEQGRGVMLVAKDKNHQERLHSLLTNKTALQEKDIYLLKGGSSIHLTDDTVKSGMTKDYKVVIVPMRMAEGYTLTRLSVMITSVYPSNNALRQQLRGRINRIGQKEKTILYRTVHCGLLTSIMKNHDTAKNLQHALEGLAKDINVTK